MNSEVDFVIVGGGAAGIAAARRLSALGASTLLLEAMDRIGGRARTVQLGGHPVDLGCGWLHSGDRNAWTAIAEQSGFAVDRRGPVWDMQYKDLGFSPDEQAAAGVAFDRWTGRLADDPPASDRASDALDSKSEWNDYIRAIAGFVSGVEPERISAADYVAYDEASTRRNWRVEDGYGALIAASLPSSIHLRTGTPVEGLDFTRGGVALATPAGTIRARAVILTVSTAVLAGDAIRLPIELEAWREAAALLPLGRDEKVFLEIVGDAPFEDETHVLGNPRSRLTGGYNIRPFGAPLIECFLGGEGARMLEEDGPVAGYEFAVAELVALFGSDIRQSLRRGPISRWRETATIGGAYSCALPGHAAARARLAKPFDDRVFFAGEATHGFDFTTAHGAHDTGVRAADEAFAAVARSRLRA